MVLLEKITTHLSLAVLPKDAFAPAEGIKGDLSMTVNEYGKKPLRHKLGYFLFMDLPEETYTITARGEYYFSITVTDITVTDPLRPIVEFEMEPNASYPFPEGATLLKGTVTTDSGAPIPGATIGIMDSPRSMITDERGRFVFYFKDVAGDEESGSINIAKTGYMAQTATYRIEEGTTKVVSIILLT